MRYATCLAEMCVIVVKGLKELLELRVLPGIITMRSHAARWREEIHLNLHVNRRNISNCSINYALQVKRQYPFKTLPVLSHTGHQYRSVLRLA